MKTPIFEKRECELCHEEFEVNIKNKRSEKKRFCSEKCAKRSNGLNNKGKKRTEEYKKTLSEKLTGKGNPFYNKKHKKESINKMRESSKWSEDRYKYCNMNKVEKEIFDGIMISDGSLSKSRISSRISFGFKYMETIKRIIKDLSSLNFIEPWKYETKPDKRTNKSYVNYYSKSNSYRDLLLEHNRWYINNIKVIPEDIILTPLLCYWWYVCDGFLLNNNVYLCTESFRYEDLLIIKDKFEKIGFSTSIRKNKRVFFTKESSIRFLNWISFENKIEIQKEYLYKWSIKK